MPSLRTRYGPRSQLRSLLQYGLIQNNHSRFEGAMNPPSFEPRRNWTVKEAKAHLSKILRLAEVEGPQQIGRRKTFVVVPAPDWYARRPPRKPMGQWLVDNMPRGVNLDVPETRGARRATPFVTGEAK